MPFLSHPACATAAPSLSDTFAPAKTPPAFSRALTLAIVGWLAVLGVVMLAALLWQGIHNTEQADRQKIVAALGAAVADIRSQVLVVEMTAHSAERIVRAVQPDNAKRLRTALEGAVAAFEQRPELSHLGIVLPTPGEYGKLERSPGGSITLWLYSTTEAQCQRWRLTEAGFVPLAGDGEDGGDRAALTGEAERAIRRVHEDVLRSAPANEAKGVWQLRMNPWLTRAAKDTSHPAAWGVSFTKALYDDAGTLLGVLDASLAIEAVQAGMRSVQAQYGVKMATLELNAPPRLITSEQATPQPVPTYFAAFLNGTQPRFSDQFTNIVPLDGERHWVAAHLLSGNIPWLVVVSRPAVWLDPLLGDMLYRVLAMVLVLALGLALIARHMVRRFGQPLAELVRRVTRIGQTSARPAAGAGADTPTPAPPSAALTALQRFRETQTLAQALDQTQAAIAREIALKEQEQARLRELNADLEFLATHDDLTELPNRMLIQQHISQAIIQSRRDGTQATVLYVNLDRFKTVNDRYGYAFGNLALKAAGDRFAQLVRPQDTVAHLSGDRFLILLTGLAQREDAARMTQYIMAGLKSPVIVNGLSLKLEASIGVSLSPQDGETVDALISNADIAMAQAKKMGRNTCQFYTAAIGQAVQARIALEAQLREVIHGANPDAQLHLVYQPKVSLLDGRITSCEALLRWTNPELGQVSPTQFVAIAEESGLIIPLGDWLMRTACQQAKAWHDAGLAPARVAVNLSARQFLQQDIVQWVTDALNRSRLPAHCLELELTESLLPQEMTKTIATLNQLHELGVTLALDDFGTGYANLAYLKHLHIHTLKIDQGFVRHVTTSAEDAAIVRSTINLAHSLGFQALAEGVESLEHVQFLREQGCDEIQGYYFSAPVGAEVYAEMLRAGRSLN